MACEMGEDFQRMRIFQSEWSSQTCVSPIFLSNDSIVQSPDYGTTHFAVTQTFMPLYFPDVIRPSVGKSHTLTSRTLIPSPTSVWSTSLDATSSKTPWISP